MKPIIYLVIDNEEDKFLLSLAFAKANLRQCIRFYPDINSMLHKLYQEHSSHCRPDLIGVSYHSAVNRKSDQLTLLKKYPVWYDVPVVLFCHNMSSYLKNKLIDDGILACLDKPSLYVDYMELAQNLITLANPVVQLNKKYAREIFKF
jgi:hypothetical protein